MSAGAAWGLLGSPLKTSVWAAHPKGCKQQAESRGQSCSLGRELSKHATRVVPA